MLCDCGSSSQWSDVFQLRFEWCKNIGIGYRQWKTSVSAPKTPLIGRTLVSSHAVKLRDQLKKLVKLIDCITINFCVGVHCVWLTANTLVWQVLFAFVEVTHVVVVSDYSMFTILICTCNMHLLRLFLIFARCIIGRMLELMPCHSRLSFLRFLRGLDN